MPKSLIELHYTFQGTEYRFRLNLASSTDQERIYKTLDWASRRDLPVYIEKPVLVASNELAAD